MKFITVIFMFVLSASVLAATNRWYKYSCTFVDSNNLPHWGGSKNSEQEAYNRAWMSCNRGEIGGCQFLGCQTHYSPAAVKSLQGYGCAATDANYGHYWGSSNVSQIDACVQAMDNCYYHSDAPGTCRIK